MKAFCVDVAKIYTWQRQGLTFLVVSKQGKHKRWPPAVVCVVCYLTPPPLDFVEVLDVLKSTCSCLVLQEIEIAAPFYYHGN